MNEQRKQAGIQLLNFFVPFGGTMFAMLIGFVELGEMKDHIKPGNIHHPPEHYEKKIDERHQRNKEIQQHFQQRLDYFEHRLDSIGG